MQNHWPILIAIVLISAAASVGLWQQQMASEAAKSRPLVPIAAASTDAPARTKATAATPRPAAATIPAPETMPLASAPALTPAPELTQAPEAAPQKKFVTPVPPAPAPLPAGHVPVAAPTAPAPLPRATGMDPAKQQQMADAKVRGREMQLQALRNALQQQMGIMPMQTAGEGYAVGFEGGRIEVQPMPQWAITIYNVNGAAAETETENFKKCMDIVIRTLTIDMTQRFADAANGTKSMLTTSSMGRIQLSRDPAQGNLCTIKPLQKNAAQNNMPVVTPPAPPVPGAPVAPLAPAAPQLIPKPAPIPVPVERKPSTDSTF